LLPPIALLALVATLGTLQYRWLGQVSEAEREQLKQSLDRRAREFADDFDREVTRLYHGLQPAAPFDPAQPEPFAQKYDQWLAATAAPALVKAVYFAKPAQPGFTLYRYDPAARAFSAVEWPAPLEVIRRRLAGTVEEKPVTGPGPGAAPAKIIAFSSTVVVPEVPALVISTPASDDVMLPRINAGGSGARMGHDILMALHMSHSHVIVELDSKHLATDVLPALITRHFSQSGGVPYRVAIVDAASKAIASRNVADGDRIDPARADVTWPFFAVRPDNARSTMLTWTAPLDPAGAKGAVARPMPSVTSQVTAVTVGPVPPDAAGKTAGTAFMTSPVTLRASGPWRLLVQHSAGSLDAAVAAARRRNLWLSFGILAVLAASVGLIVVNARRSERLAAQQMDFVAAVSHELRTPLAVIRSAAQNLSAGVVHEAGQARRYGELIETEGRRLTEMVEQVLEYAGLEAHRRTPLAPVVDAGALVSDTVSSCSALFDAEGFDVSVAVAPNLPPVAADEGALRRAISNLLMNALKHAASGRSVAVDVRAASQSSGSGVEIAVTDKGPGIPTEDLGHIFEPFYRGRHATEQQVHGNGLGLSLVQRIAEAHGGRVTVTSAPGAGATFTLYLPAAAAHTSVQPLDTPAEAGGSAH
jgi:signal transduction histidine kinase